MNTTELVVEMRPEKNSCEDRLYLFFTTVHLYDFHQFPVITHHLEGLFESNIINSSQLACQLSWQSPNWYCRGHGSNPVWPEIFSGLISTTSSVVFIAARIAYISLGQLVEKYSFYCKKFFDLHRKGGVIKCIYNCLYFGQCGFFHIIFLFSLGVKQYSLMIRMTNT